MQETQEVWIQTLGGDPLEKEMAPHSSVLAWRIPWTEEPGGLQSMGSHRVGHDWAGSTGHRAAVLAAALFTSSQKQLSVHQQMSGWRCGTYTPRNTAQENTMAPHSSTLAWKIPWMEEPGRLRSMGSLRVRHDWVTSLSLFTFMHWRRKWQPTPVFLPGESQGRGSPVGCRLWGHTESDTTEAT